MEILKINYDNLIDKINKTIIKETITDKKSSTNLSRKYKIAKRK